MSTTIDEMKQRLAVLTPHLLEIIDDSAKHAGHRGNTGGGHYQLTIVSDAFASLSPVERHRKVYSILSDLMSTHIHALSINARTTNETA